MEYQYVIYIDEAGDDGIGKLREADGTGQSRWFGVGACCVRFDEDKNLVAWRDEVANSFLNRQSRDIHFKNLKHDQRRFACSVLGSKPVRVAVALSNKVTLLDLPAHRLQTFKRKNHLHNYLTRWLLERVSACLKVHALENKLINCKAKIVFSRRGGMNYGEFQEYLNLIRMGKEVIYSPGKIDWDVISPDLVEAQDHSKKAGLQLADISTIALFKGVEPNRYGQCELSYAKEFKKVMFRNPRTGEAYNYGVTHIPQIDDRTPLSLEQKEFFNLWKM